MSAAFDVLVRCPGVLYGACEGIWVMTLFAEPTESDMNEARPALRAMSKRHPAGFPTLTWILPQAGYVMENDARKAATAVTQEFQHAIRAQATLIEGTGFQAATVRAIVTGLDFMSRSAAAKRVFSELAPAVAWCVSHCPERGAAPEAEVTSSILEACSGLGLRR